MAGFALVMHERRRVLFFPAVALLLICGMASASARALTSPARSYAPQHQIEFSAYPACDDSLPPEMRNGLLVASDPINWVDLLGLSESAAMAWLAKFFTYGGDPNRNASYMGQALFEDVAKPYCEGMAQGAAIVGTVAVGSALPTVVPAVPALARTALLFPLRYPKETSGTLAFLDQLTRNFGAQPPVVGALYNLSQGGPGDTFLGPGPLRVKQFSGSQTNQSTSATGEK